MRERENATVKKKTDTRRVEVSQALGGGGGGGGASRRRPWRTCARPRASFSRCFSARTSAASVPFSGFTTATSRCSSAVPLKCRLFMLQAMCRTSPGLRSNRRVCTSFGSDCVSSTVPLVEPGSLTSKGTREATWRLVNACFVPLHEFSRF